jgi:lipopolysaccharide/colanic/teichoic acid biosynthesis glycosyltransferase
MIFSDGFRQGRIHGSFERAFDIAASLGLLAITFPVMLLTALAILLEDGRKASLFYRQTRVGQYGRNFELLKFRSMRENAEAKGEEKWAEKNDSRVSGPSFARAASTSCRRS